MVNDVFICHKQSTGHGIALSLYLNLKDQCDAFVYIKGKFDIEQEKELYIKLLDSISMKYSL